MGYYQGFSLVSFEKASPFLGDFNQLETGDQKIGGNNSIKGSKTFLDWKEDCKLMDIPFHGVPFTWTNNRQGNETIFKRLDRAYCNDSWRNDFPDAITLNFPIFISDHGPIIVDCHPTSTNKNRSYKIEAWCLEFEYKDEHVKKS